jgi:hypothetical protein
MDILNLISWIKAGNYKTTLPTDVNSLIPVAAQDPSRDDGYLPLAVNAAPLQSLYNTGNVTQITNITTPVTINTLNGIITTVSATVGIGTTVSFVVNNSNVKATSKIIVSTEYISTGNGIPVFRVSDIVDGSFRLVVSYPSSLIALNNVVKAHFLFIS